jgi:alanyl-tRNA synthetase
MTDTSNLRKLFLQYFEGNGHTIVPSSSLVPGNDPTLLFTNAGMVQFKDLFLGLEKREYTRATTSQRCVRAGGKHNDLENVGYTARHHTFFEMLGNFSFGDYFKEEAINYAWEFLTNILAIPEEKLWITVFEDDKDAEDIWLKKIGVSEDRFSRCGEKDNFWAMGDTGPCGPCSEIFYDHGDKIPGGPPGSPEQEGDRYVEIWNLVFTQYDRSPDGTLNPIPEPSVDTGMGLERIAAVLQGVHTNYDIDLFQHLINAIYDHASAVTKLTHEFLGSDDKCVSSARVIADHIRACAFLIIDGVVPSNEGRGYVLRRIIRRAIRHGSKLGFSDPFFYQLVKPLSEVMGDAYPELLSSRKLIEQVLQKEEDRFNETLENGLKHLETAIASASDKTIPGEDVFKLYDTYGFPVDLTADIARERGLELDMKGFDKCMEAQRVRARAASKFDVEQSFSSDASQFVTEFRGYESLNTDSKVVALYRDGGSVKELKAGQFGGVILEATSFYAESGGQLGDRGELSKGSVYFQVQDTQKQGKAHIHIGELNQGVIKIGDKLTSSVDVRLRTSTVRNHSATHLMHAALRSVLGEHVAQKGSMVAADKLRFDFSHSDPVSPEELKAIENMVNRKILENTDTKVEVMALEDAKQTSAMSLFGEKYEAKVRVLTIGGKFSVELCGGTHVKRAGDIGLFKITSETGIAAGVRRIEAVTGEEALEWVAESEDQLESIAHLLKAGRDSVLSKLEQNLDRTKKLEKEVEQLKSKMASSTGDDMASTAEDIDGIKVLARSLDDVDPKTLRETVDQLKNKLGTAALVLAAVNGDKISLVAGVTNDSTDRIKAGDLVNFVAQQVGGKGGGRADMAQAGGNNPAALEGALASVPAWIQEQIQT